jgi:hypothetical protein
MAANFRFQILDFRLRINALFGFEGLKRMLKK